LKKTILLSALALAAAATGSLLAHDHETKPAAAPAAAAAPTNTISAGAKMTYGVVTGFIAKSAAKMPEENYSYKPTPEVKSFGEILGHVADANYGFCAAVAGEKPPAGGFDPAQSIEKSKTKKADLEKALADAFAYCQKVHASLDDRKGAETIKFFNGDMAKLSVLELNTHHTFEHYGNIITYLRLKGLVPPSTEGRM
jgi:uncharacterized damage-inducible protein DinB